MFATMSALEKAIDILGGVQATADKFGLSYMAIRQWREREVPVKHCISLERMTDGAVTCEELRPEVFAKSGKAA